MPDVIAQFNDSLKYVPPPIDASGQVIPDPDIQAKLNPPAPTPAPEPEPTPAPGNVQEVEDRGGVGSNFISRTASALGYAEGRARQAYDWTASRPTPGGSGAILTAIILILFAAIPVTKQGKTRLELVYWTLMGKSFLLGRQSPLGNQGGGAIPTSYSDAPAVQIAYQAQGPTDFSEL
jgi:hypothetical protein